MTTTSTKVIEKLKKGFQKFENINDEKREIPEEILPYFLHDMPPFLVEEACRDLNETDEIRGKALEEFKKLINDEINLVTRSDDIFLLAFLRARKFNVKKAFKLFRNFWSFRKEYRYIFDTANPEFVRKLVHRDFIGFLPNRDRYGSVVVIAKVADWDPDVSSYDDLFRAISGMLLMAIESPVTQVAGFRAVIDGREGSWKQMKYCTPSNLMLLIRSTQFCFPGRYKGIHVICENRMVNMIWSMVYPLLTSKLKKRIFFHGEDLSPLTEYIHPSVLPSEFGGQAERFENSKWKDYINESTETCMNMLKYGYKD